jgi:DNA polymerase-4
MSSPNCDEPARKIIHIDMDAFYASIEMRDNPSLKSRPIAVGGDPGRRGVIATANYAARKYGVHSAMASWKAKKLCPDLLILFPDFTKYRQESRAIHDIFRSFTEIIEPLSLDEAFLDVSGSPFFGGSATLIAQEICSRIWKERGLTASAGVAPNKFLAKVASEWNKPNGLFVIAPRDVEAFVKDLPIEKLWGVGQAAAQKFHALDIYTCGQLQKFDLFKLHDHFGSRAWTLFELCRGIDKRVVETEHIRKSVSVETTFPHDLLNLESCLREVPELYQSLVRRYERLMSQYAIKKPFVKVKFADFRVTTVENRLYPVASLDNYKALVAIGWARKKQAVRLLGLGVTLSLSKEKEVQLTLF